MNSPSHVQNSPELVPVFSGEIAGVCVQLVNARDLHSFLEVRRDFTNWIKARIAKFGFVENEDYLLAKFGEQVPHQGGTRAVERTDYHITLDMAKELAMVENNSRGREVRRYFIDCERRAADHRHSLPPAHDPTPRPAFRYVRFRTDGVPVVRLSAINHILQTTCNRMMGKLRKSGTTDFFRNAHYVRLTPNGHPVPEWRTLAPPGSDVEMTEAGLMVLLAHTDSDLAEIATAEVVPEFEKARQRAADPVPVPLALSGRLLMTIENGQIVRAEAIRPDEQVCSIAMFLHGLKLSGLNLSEVLPPQAH